MGKAADTKSRIHKIGDVFRRSARNAPLDKALLLLAGQTYPKLIEQGLSDEDSLVVLGKWFSPWARRCSPEDFVKATMGIVGRLRHPQGLYDQPIAVAVGCAIVSLKRYRD